MAGLRENGPSHLTRSEAVVRGAPFQSACFFRGQEKCPPGSAGGYILPLKATLEIVM
jgi:hypothetical protein